MQWSWKAYLERESVEDVVSKIDRWLISAVSKKISTGDGGWTLEITRT
jgi:uncharacterized protein YlzI (FlbEa/FlbD family)